MSPADFRDPRRRPIDAADFRDPSEASRENRRCSERRRDGQPCRAFAVVGCTACRAHGGEVSPERRAADHRRAEAKRERGLAAYEELDRKMSAASDRVMADLADMLERGA